MYTLVQHSAYGYNGDGTFSRAVETRRVTSKQAQQIAAIGGRVFPTYDQAETGAMQANYPDPDYHGLIPNAQGTFARKKIDGLRVYIEN